MRTLAAAAMLLGLVGTCYGFHAVKEVGPLRVEVFAPDWVWQRAGASSSMGADVNILVILTNTDTRTVTPSILQTPDSSNAFEMNFDQSEFIVQYQPERSVTPTTVFREQPGNHFGGNWQLLWIEGGWTARIALPAYYASDIYPPGIHFLTIEILVFQAFSELSNIDSILFDPRFTIPIRTIRGAAVSDGLWAKLLPALTGLVWCGVVTFFIRRYIKPGTWRQTFTPDTEELHPCENP